MTARRYIVELGTGIDLHGENMTEAACRAVKDAISRSCLCGLLEILNLETLNTVRIEIQVAVPEPDKVDLEKVAAQVPIGKPVAQAIAGGMQAPGLCVPRFGPGCDTIVVANAAVTVWIEQ